MCLIRNTVLHKHYFALPKPFNLFIYLDPTFGLERLVFSLVFSLSVLHFSENNAELQEERM